MKVAVVGCGKIAEAHLQQVARLDGRARVVALADREPLLAEQLALRYGIAAHYGDTAELLERERPDVVHLTTPPDAHLPLARQALAAGAHVYVEKPFTLSAADSRELIAEAERADRKVTVGYSGHFEPAALRMRDLVRAGAIGEPVHVSSFVGYDLDGQFGRAVFADPQHWVHGLPGRLFHNVLDHALYRICEFLPDDEPRVLAHGSILRRERYGDERDRLHDELRVIVAGERVTGSATFSAHARPVARVVRVHGTEGTLVADHAANAVTVTRDRSLPGPAARVAPVLAQARDLAVAAAANAWRGATGELHYFSGLQTHLERFYDSIERDLPPPYPYRDIVRVSALLDEIVRQVEQEDVR